MIEQFGLNTEEAVFRRGPIPLPEAMATIRTGEYFWSGSLVSVNRGTAYYACKVGQESRRIDHPDQINGSNYAHSKTYYSNGNPGLDPIVKGETLVKVEWGTKGHHCTYGQTITLLDIPAEKWSEDQAKGARRASIRAIRTPFSMGTSSGACGKGIYELPDMVSLRWRAKRRAEANRMMRLREHAEQRKAHSNIVRDSAMNPLLRAINAWLNRLSAT